MVDGGSAAEGRKSGESGESRYAYTLQRSRGVVGCELSFATRKSDAAEMSCEQSWVSLKFWWLDSGRPRKEPTLNSSMKGQEMVTQYRASTTLACAVTDCGNRKSKPAACVRLCMERNMASWRSWGKALRVERLYSCSTVARGLVMCDMVEIDRL